MWSSPHGPDASSYKIWCIYLYLSSPELLTFFQNSRWRPCEFGHSGVLIVWYLCSVRSLVQISVIVTEIVGLMLQTLIHHHHHLKVCYCLYYSQEHRCMTMYVWEEGLRETTREQDCFKFSLKNRERRQLSGVLWKLIPCRWTRM